MNLRFLSYLMLAIALVAGAVSCNKNSDDSTTTTYSIYSSTTTLVTNFTLTENNNVLRHLDSVFFSIDQEKGVIFNADSLPKGTDVSKLCVNVTGATTVSKMEFIINGGKVQDNTTITYTSTTTDTIDFTGDVKLRVTAGDGLTTRTYSVKVNVHSVEPDSLSWAQSKRRDLPNMSGTVSASKTVVWRDGVACLMCDNGNYVLSTAASPEQGTWDKLTPNFGFTPDVDSFTGSDEGLFILGSDGELYASSDGTTWSSCGVQWRSIVGSYSGRALGVIADGSALKHDEYPQPDGFASTTVEQGFPVERTSPMVLASNAWTSFQQAMIAGGRTADGQLTDEVWGYDGKQWGRVSSSGNTKRLPALEGAMLVPYYTHTLDTIHYTATRNLAWYVMGGKLADGTINRTVYVSTDQGINWVKSAVCYQLPDYLPSLWRAQAIVWNLTMKSSSSSSAPRRATYKPTIVTPITEWECPYIYVFGGYGSTGTAQPDVWRGVINRLEFHPVI